MKLFSSYQLGAIALKNRLVMAPMTRCRALGNLANPLMAEYYQQRAGAGLIVTEGTSPSPNGLGYARIPGLYNTAQADSWRQVSAAVHAAGGKIFLQLMHCGRVSHLINLPQGAEVLAPSAVTFGGKMWTDTQGELPCSPPRAMTAAEVHGAIAEYVEAARLAIDAGFDGIELHGANGYLINQFLDQATNQRADDYGGSWQNRNRFAFEVASAVVAAIGAGRTGIRLSPHGVFNDMTEYADLTAQYAALANGLGKLGLAYIHLVDQSALGMAKPLQKTTDAVREGFRAAGGGALILSGGYDRERAEADLQSGAADLIAFGRPYLANPDLETRLEAMAELNPYDEATFYMPDEKGYVDYPFLAQ
ncbi:alkene reductase [Geopsychrobacter electrodiphilus]|uniref:alkene reductase n=1 Tax=Geopsychrobacter electrodiphilus TaxID=225196 RepID=UPI00037123AC|nr:alkene reductase [Geopsychrobacter electrodiphilus]